MKTIHDILYTQAKLNPTNIALYWQSASISFLTLSRRVQKLCVALSAIGKQGSRIAVLAWNCPQFIELIYAASASGRVLVPINARLAPAEIEYQLRLSGAIAIFGDKILLSKLPSESTDEIDVISFQNEYESWLINSDTKAPCIKINEHDMVWILFTSGSTGKPKGAELTHSSFLNALKTASIARPVKQTDRYLFPFPLFHVAAHNVLLQHQYGAAVVLMKSFNATDALCAIRQLQVTTLSLAPTMIAMLLEQADFQFDDLEHVRSIGYGASAMPATLLQTLLSNTNVGLCQGYGMTELSGNVVFLSETDHRLAVTSKPQLLTSIGKPAGEVQVMIVNERNVPCSFGEVGEIIIKAKQCMRGYYKNLMLSQQAIVNDYLYTGDLGYIDKDGYLYMVDRKKDMIVSGGENIASKEVEEVLRGHSKIIECAVIGLPDAKWGEKACAVVVSSEPVTDKELSSYCKQKIASYKTPKKWFRLVRLPINSTGKIDKKALREMFCNRA
ncbi:class I adenylate-forming enzyme family protein [Aliiglaciecola lipolytica]|uniref:O-succinylbenzoic acid--CoA ligase n=1 Tax=Aliiglaciecola lipolytica E3 TaxID=1127673 RepID=K6XQP4_9ALTE|nr:AMP-binding protein [Aliiglaciecola lipolytica]GAC14011.1 O-succinylbenzoic acid--CoA ligase [Aliiglaciecola lipolytica E3]